MKSNLIQISGVTLLLSFLFVNVLASDSCEYSNDGVCDVPVYCDHGTDDTDCNIDQSSLDHDSIDNSCEFAFDGTCDVPIICDAGTDTYDCENTNTSLLALILNSLFFIYLGSAIILSFVSSFPGKWWLVFGLLFLGLPDALLRIDYLFTFPAWFEFLAPIFLFIGLIKFLFFRNSHPSNIVDIYENTKNASLIQRNDSNSITKAEKTRDEIHRLFVETCENLKLTSDIYKSPPFNQSIWVKVIISKKTEGEATVRGHVAIEIIPREYHEFDPVISISYFDGKNKTSYRSLISLNKKDCEDICNYLAGNTNKRKIKARKCKYYPWEILYPKNKLLTSFQMNRFDSLTVILLIAVFLSSLHEKLVFFGYLIAGIIIIYKLMQTKRIFNLTSGKPSQEPRELAGLDSWQAVIYDIGVKSESVKKKTLESLLSKIELSNTHRSSGYVTDNVTINEEHIWYEGIDGKIERKQIVVGLRRALLFLHIYEYGTDLYIGWDAHINFGYWDEKIIASGELRETGNLTNLISVEASWKQPNEYDITDANFLIEWVHSVITRVVKSVVKEYQIDQEIDFSILREQRQEISKKKKPKTNGLLAPGKLKRIS